jgi:hypothetical protein
MNTPSLRYLGLLAILACKDHPVAPPVVIPSSPVASIVTDAVSTFQFSKNMHPLGFSARTVPLTNSTAGAGIFNSDLAFWGQRAYQGTFEGFRIVDIADPGEPVELVNYANCSPGSTAGNQGDIAVWANLLVRSWSSPASATASCGGSSVPAGDEGLHIFNVSNPSSPALLTFVSLPCGARAATIVPDLPNGRLIVYSASASALCPQIDITEIPLANPASAQYLRAEPKAPLGEVPTGACSDVAVILGVTMRLACPGGSGVVVWSIGAPGGGSLTDPAILGTVSVPGMTQAASVSWSWDGRVMILGHEAGGGSSARCQATSSVLDRSIFFFDAVTGGALGSFVLPRAQSAVENCSWGRFSVVPDAKRDILVSGNFQSGVSVVDFTDPANAVEIAYADPAPLVDPDPPPGIELGGAWAAYWYRGFIYQSDITRGLIVWKLSESAVAGATRLQRFNPQTLEP